MKINIAARRTTVKDSFRDRAAKKLAKLDRFFDDDVVANITVTNERERETVEITLQAVGLVFRAEKTTADRADSLDACVDLLFRQIVKNKNKLETRLRSAGFETPADDVDFSDVQSDDFTVVKNKRFLVKPMDVDEAILQMNMLNHEFFLFANSATGDLNVIYKRKDGNYGLIEPIAE